MERIATTFRRWSSAGAVFAAAGAAVAIAIHAASRERPAEPSQPVQAVTPAAADAPPPAVVWMGPRLPLDAWAELAPAGDSWSLGFAKPDSKEDSLRLTLDPTGEFKAVLNGERVVAQVQLARPPESVWLRRRGEGFSVWADGRHAFAASAVFPGDARLAFAAAEDARPRGMSARECGDAEFADTFMRAGPDESWRALSGVWELAGIRFPERSANPFSLFARFPGLERADDFAESRWKTPATGVGVHLSSWRGMTRIERITGGGPADRAGLVEGDLLLAIDDGDPHAHSGYGDLRGPEGSRVRLVYLREGETAPRQATLTRETYRWARETYGQPLPGSADPSKALAGGFGFAALAVAGEPWWDGYRYEASVALKGAGGAGIAFGLRDESNYHALVMVSEAPEGAGFESFRLALVRVREGRSETLAEREWGPRPGGYYRLGVDLVGPRISASVDGEAALEATDADLPAGRIGLWALRGAGAHFDDVAVATDRARAALPDERRANAVHEDEQDMRGWADPAEDWLHDSATGWWWNRYRFPGDARVEVSPGAAYEAFAAILGARLGEPSSGVAFEIADGIARISHEGRVVAEAETVIPRGSGLVLALDAVGRASVTLGGGGPEVVSASIGAGLGDRAAMRGLANLDERGALQVSSSNSIDYYFRNSPADWTVSSGRWGILNKWICDPRFSWFGGHSRSLAAAWNKRELSGGVTLDFFAALVMIWDDPPFERSGDFACNILGDGRSLDTGYTLIVSGGRNRWTRLYGDGRLLAESTDPADRMPCNILRPHLRRALHQRWFGISLERIDGRVRYRLDGRTVFDVPDSIGRESGHAAVWTQDNGMLVARARLAADALGRPEGLRWDERAARTEMHGVTNEVLGEVWTELTEDGRGPTGAPAVRARNLRGGGAFGVKSIASMQRHDSLAFQFRAEPGARVDLYLLPEDDLTQSRLGPYRVRLTGPEGLNERHPALAGPLARDDGEWRAIEIAPDRLFESFSLDTRGFEPSYTQGRFRAAIMNVQEGTDPGEYLPAGIGGNGFGKSFWISDLRILGSRDRQAAPFVEEALFPGQRGTPKTELHILIGGPAPQGRSIMVTLALLGEEGAVENEVALRAGHDAFAYDPAAGVLKVYLPWAGIPLRRGATLAADVQVRGAPSFAATWAVEGGVAITEIEPMPRIPGEVLLDFDDPWRSRRLMKERARPDVAFKLVSRGEGRALRVLAPKTESALSMMFVSGMTDLSRLQRLSFDYRFEPHVPANLIVNGRRGRHGVVFTDVAAAQDRRDGYTNYVGRFEGAAPDGTWRSAGFDLARTFQRAFPHESTLPATGIALADQGWKGMWPGDGYEIDMVEIVGARRGETLAARVAGWAPAGLDAVAVSIDAEPLDEIEAADPAPVEGARGAFDVTVPVPGAASLPDGEYWIHASARERGGEWSAVHRSRVLVDNTPPRVTGWSANPRALSISLEDFSGVEPESIRVRVGDTLFRVDGEACVFDRSEGTLRLMLPEEVERGREMRAELVAARDVCGNRISEPVLFEWAQGDGPPMQTPAPASVRFTSVPGSSDPVFGDSNDFEMELGPVKALRGSEIELSEAAARSGRLGLRCRVAAGRGGVFAIRLRERLLRVDEMPFVMFDYRLPEGEVELLSLRFALWSGQVREVELIGPNARAPLVADGRWRSAILDLREAVRGWEAEWPRYLNRELRLAHTVLLVGVGAPGGAFDLDNLEFVHAHWPSANVVVELPSGLDASLLRGVSLSTGADPAALGPPNVAREIGLRDRGEVRVGAPDAARLLRAGAEEVHMRVDLLNAEGGWGEPVFLELRPTRP